MAALIQLADAEDSDTHDSDEEIDTSPSSKADTRPGKLREQPTVADALRAADDLRLYLRGPLRGKSMHSGYNPPALDKFAEPRLHGLLSFLNLYTIPESSTYGKWGASALQAAIANGKYTHFARQKENIY